jgi:hypothetical protein
MPSWERHRVRPSGGGADRLVRSADDRHASPGYGVGIAHPHHGQPTTPRITFQPKGTLPLIDRHFNYDKTRFVIIDPHADEEIARKYGVRFIKQAITRENYAEVLTPLLTEGGGQGFCINPSVDTGSVDLMRMTREIGALYIDTVVEPWLGFYSDKSAGPGDRTNYALRETLLAENAGYLVEVPPYQPAAQTREWCRGWSSRRC